MVTPKEDAVGAETRGLGPAAERGREVGRGGSGVAPLLIHLIGGRLDHQRRPELAGGPEGRVEHGRVGGADRPDPLGEAPLLGGDHVQEGPRAGEAHSSAGAPVSHLSHRSRFSATACRSRIDELSWSSMPSAGARSSPLPLLPSARFSPSVAGMTSGFCAVTPT